LLKDPSYLCYLPSYFKYKDICKEVESNTPPVMWQVKDFKGVVKKQWAEGGVV